MAPSQSHIFQIKWQSTYNASFSKSHELQKPSNGSVRVFLSKLLLLLTVKAILYTRSLYSVALPHRNKAFLSSLSVYVVVNQNSILVHKYGSTQRFVKNESFSVCKFNFRVNLCLRFSSKVNSSFLKIIWCYQFELV